MMAHNLMTCTELRILELANDECQKEDIDVRHIAGCNKKDELSLFHGKNEIQVSEGGEVDLQKHYSSCEKNSGHKHFTPVNDFNISLLPNGCRDNEIVELIKATADLTVRIDVKMTSEERPEFWPNTTVPYASYSTRGSDVMRLGTGSVWRVQKKTEDANTCTCHTCQHSYTPSKVWGEVWMYTAKHVVFDDLEVGHTTCRLFYDVGDSPLVTLQGWTVLKADIKEDWCLLKYITCDVDLLDKLDRMWRHWDVLRKKVINKYKRSTDDKLSFIVSHPHGLPKQVSVGNWIDRKDKRQWYLWSRFNILINASVSFHNKDLVKARQVFQKMAQILTHTELDINKQANENGGDNDTDDNGENDCTNKGQKDGSNKNDEARLFYGTHETQVSEGGETDSHKRLLGCKKNPGHKQFVPVTDFNTGHLPDGYHDHDIFEYIKATADLTVGVDVKMTSTERPEFWLNSTVPYAFYNMRGSDVTRLGTGMVLHVNKRTEEDSEGPCQCHTCQHSETPSKVWGEVWMVTATHVVFDDLEARHTTCRLFYDRPDSSLVTLGCWTVDDADIEEDRCWLYCVTCDVDLLDKLMSIRKHWEELWDKLNTKYESSRDEGKLIFIVSHPHGCPKQVSVGHWIDRYVVGEDRTKYTYTTSTCPGSSGAHVHSLGYNGWYYGIHVHSGVNSEGTNFSGTGRDYDL